MAKVKSERDLVDHGIQALADALGYSGAARFLRHFSKGNGDYLQTQEKLFRECVWTRYLKRPVSIIPANSVDGFLRFRSNTVVVCAHFDVLRIIKGSG